MPGDLVMHAYALPRGVDMPIVPAGRDQQWMTDSQLRNATRCLPLLVANQAAWWVLNPRDLVVRWDGSPEASGLSVRYLDDRDGSHFGHGILTFQIPYLVRTPSGWNLLVRGPANLPKDGATALEGIVESDWAVVTFTMNWQVTRPDTDIGFVRDEPVCALVPHRCGDLERIAPVLDDFADMPERGKYLKWRRARHEFRESEPGWQSDYMKGRRLDGAPATEHQVRLNLSPFERSR